MDTAIAIIVGVLLAALLVGVFFGRVGLIILAWILFMLIDLTLIGGIVYVIYHFASKYW